MEYEKLLSSLNKEDLTYVNLLSCLEWQIKRMKIFRRDGLNCTRCSKAAKNSDLRFFLDIKGDIESLSFSYAPHGFDVHHLHYIKGRLPWEYENNALISVCRDCHVEIHRTETIKLYDIDGVTELETNACNRCSGEGFIELYRHVQGGICFKCRGVGKELSVFS